ncbi:MAG: hypothetical protein WC291_02660 [Thermodesulfovibrionales bacterium]|jgi:hypothetical protein
MEDQCILVDRRTPDGGPMYTGRGEGLLMEDQCILGERGVLVGGGTPAAGSMYTGGWRDSSRRINVYWWRAKFSMVGSMYTDG